MNEVGRALKNDYMVYAFNFLDVKASYEGPITILSEVTGMPLAEVAKLIQDTYDTGGKEEVEGLLRSYGIG